MNPDLEISELDHSETIKALLVGCYMSKADELLCNQHLDELDQLVETRGYQVAGHFPCYLRKFHPATCLTTGKLEELEARCESLTPDVVIFDDEISPSQQRNLEKHLKIPVADRTEIILDVFSLHAQSKEARLQIDLAKAQYDRPRLKRMWNHLHRQRGGGGSAQKGEGEKQIELDRRMLARKMENLRTELKEVKAHRARLRQGRKRSNTPIFAIVGYTNAGKSSLLNAMTDAGVLVEDQLFATLDTTTRQFQLPNKQEVLLIDTVGFIRKLPHNLVEAFKSTLEESAYADILLHLVDVSDPLAVEHAEASIEVLRELEVHDKPIITVLNKIDKAENTSIQTQMRLLYPKTVPISATTGEGIEDLVERMMQALADRRTILNLRIPQSNYELVSKVLAEAQVMHQDYEDNDVLLRAEIPTHMLHLVEEYSVQTTVAE